MSSVFSLYVVNERDLPTMLHGSDQEKYEAIVRAIKSNGGRWGTLEMGISTFSEALEAIDAQFGSTGFLPVLAFNNSPHDLLGSHGDCPCLGYFNPEQARDLYVLLERIPTDTFAPSGDVEGPDVEGVYHEFVIAAEDAARHGNALAMIHS